MVQIYGDCIYIYGAIINTYHYSMKNLYNLFLKIGLIILLSLLFLFDFSYEQYQIARFLLIASFAWLSIIENEVTRRGWRFVFAVLVILFNPFYKLDIGRDNWKNIDLVVALLIAVNLLSVYSFYNVIKRIKVVVKNLNEKVNFKKIYRIALKCLITIVIGFLIWLAYTGYKRIKQEKALAKIKVTQDSLSKIAASTARINDSINEVRRIKKKKINDSLRTIKRIEVCNNATALANFKSYMRFYYPTWQIKNEFKIKSDDDCSFEISTLIKSTKYGGYGDFEALIVRIRFLEEGYYQQYHVTIIKSPILFDN